MWSGRNFGTARIVIDIDNILYEQLDIGIGCSLEDKWDGGCLLLGFALFIVGAISVAILC